MGRSPVIAGVHFVRKRLAGGGTRWYVYAWRGGPHVMSADGRPKPKLTAVAIDAINRALQTREDDRAPNPNTLLSLIRMWRSEHPDRPSSPEWDRLAANTKKTWGSALNKIEEKWADVPLAVFDDPRMTQKVIAWRNSRRDTPRAADIGITVLQALLKFGIQHALLSRNVADGITKLYENGQRVDIVWTENDIAAFEAAAEPKDQATVDAVKLAAVTGLRREDLAWLTWAGVREFTLVKEAAKRSAGKRRFATIPRIPELDAVLADLRDRRRMPGVDTVLVTGAGQPWNLDTLSKEVTRIAKKAGIAHVDTPKPGQPPRIRGKHLHDIRGTFATRLMTTTDLIDEEIADIMGWSPEEVRRIRTIYVDDHARNVALGRRIARGSVNRDCKPEPRKRSGQR